MPKSSSEDDMADEIRSLFAELENWYQRGGNYSPFFIDYLL
jgi:hypothetical protein